MLALLLIDLQGPQREESHDSTTLCGLSTMPGCIQPDAAVESLQQNPTLCTGGQKQFIVSKCIESNPGSPSCKEAWNAGAGYTLPLQSWSACDASDHSSFFTTTLVCQSGSSCQQAQVTHVEVQPTAYLSVPVVLHLISLASRLYLHSFIQGGSTVSCTAVLAPWLRTC